jgi:hypothetical protein
VLFAGCGRVVRDENENMIRRVRTRVKLFAMSVCEDYEVQKHECPLHRCKYECSSSEVITG